MMSAIGFRRYLEPDRLWALTAIVLCMALCSGFSVPSPGELKKELQEELKQIREMTPEAKGMALWKRERECAEAAIRKAEISGAPRYASESWTETTGLFSRAEGYAAERSFRKAAFLARKAREAAEKTGKEAREAREEKREEARDRIALLQKALDRLAGMVSPDDERMTTELDHLTLELRDLANAMDLEQFEDVLNGADRLGKKLDSAEAEIAGHQ
jgi:hypothetical protein